MPNLHILTSRFCGIFVALSLLSAGCGGTVPTDDLVSRVAPTPTPRTTCPDQDSYVEVASLSPYSASHFCAAKFEMKQVSGAAQSVAAGLPWVSIARDDAIAACQALGTGYDLISNAEWMTIARQIQAKAENWDTGAVGGSMIVHGHTDGTPAALLAASTDDVSGNCYGTGQTCSSTVWSDQRRTSVLSNGNLIWDFAGNAFEWVKDTSTTAQGTNNWVSLIGSGSQQDNFGADSTKLCSSSSATPYCEFGYLWTNYTSGAIMRGGQFDSGRYGGVFTAYLNTSGSSGASTGFRCVYHFQ